MNRIPPPTGCEYRRLSSIARSSTYAHYPNSANILCSAMIFSRFWHGRSCLELGPAEGLMTGILSKRFRDLTVVDGAKRFCSRLRRRYPRAHVVNTLFECFQPGRAFDTIILGHVLEHVQDPIRLLKRARSWLSPRGVLCAAVPNANSLHRQAAVIMGLLPRVEALNKADHQHGHRRVFDMKRLLDAFRKAGMRIQASGGYWLKPVSNAQIRETWTPEMLDAFMILGEQYPDCAGELYVIGMR